MTRFKRAVWRIGSADAVTWLSFWLTFTGAVIASFVSTSGGISMAFRLGVVGIGQLVLWAPLVFARWVVLRMDPEGRTPIATAILGAFFLGASARTLFIGFAFISAVGPEAALWPTRIFGSFGTIGLVFALTAYAVNSAREQRRRIQELEVIQADLERSVIDVRVGIQERGDQSVERVRSVLETELASLQSNDADAAVESLERMARNVVRPLSHELADAPTLQTETGAGSSAQVSWVKVLDLAAQGRPFRPLPTAILLLVLALGSISAYPPATLGFLTIPFAAYGVVAIANRIVERLFGQRPLGARLAILILTAVGSGAVVAAIGFTLMIGQPVQRGTTLGCLFFTIIFSLCVAANTALDTDRQLTITRLNAATAQLRRNLAHVNQVRWFQERALSRALHGPVQTTISAAALKLDAAMRTGSMSSPLIDQVRADITRDLDVLGDATSNAVSLDDGIASIIGTWEGVCGIDVYVDEAAAEIAAEDAPLRACAIAIASEAISNAIRHGKSTSAQLSITTAADDDALVIELDSTCLDTISAPPANAQGLGTRQLDECTTSWALEVHSGGQFLRAVLPSRRGPAASGAHQPLRLA